MATKELLDFETLLAPIPGDSPVGRDLRTSQGREYDELGEDLQTVRQVAVKHMLESTAAPPRWKDTVIQPVQEFLRSKTKDLDLAFWLLEALAYESGFAGIRDGLRLLRQLVEKYWDAGLYRGEDPLVVLTFMNEDAAGLMQHLTRIPLTQSVEGEIYSRNKLAIAEHLEGIESPETRAREIQNSGISLEAFRKTVAASSVQFYRDTKDDLDQALVELQNLRLVLEAKCGKDARGRSLVPDTSNIQKALEDCRAVIEEYAKDKLVMPKSPELTEGTPDAEALIHPEDRAGDARKTRKSAVQDLKRLARFFRDTEPHSPVSYALERIVEWCDLPLPELFSQIITDEGPRMSVFHLVGIRPPTPKEPPKAP